MVEELYQEKGRVGSYYTLVREDVVRFLEGFVQKNGLQLVRVLEIGCSGGCTGKLIKERLGVEFYAGVELMPDAAKQAAGSIDWIRCDNIEEMIEQGRLGELPAGRFDAVLFLDVLEHLYNPWKVVNSLSGILSAKGILVGSIPNAGNLYVLWKIMRDRFEYEDEGLLDRTHLRFFTLHTIRNMLQERYELVHLDSNHATWKKMNWKLRFVFAATLGLWKRLFIRQYLFIGKVRPS
jgi:SAM-dependent methyltransferase